MFVRWDISPSLVAFGVQDRKRDALFPNPFIFDMKAEVSSTIVGYARWLAPQDRRSTGGEPLPEENAEKARVKSHKDAMRNELDEEKDTAADQAFGKVFWAELHRVRKSILQGEPHWYLVSLIGRLSGFRETKVQCKVTTDLYAGRSSWAFCLSGRDTVSGPHCSIGPSSKPTLRMCPAILSPPSL